MGVVKDYNEALDIEEIVKAFVIKQRIFYLLSVEKKKKIENVEDSNIIISPSSDIKYSETENKKNIQTKNEEEISPVFNVRGLI